MRETTPQVHLVAQPSVDYIALDRYLNGVGADGWLQRWLQAHRLPGRRNSQGDLLTEIAGRLCYRSWEPGLNPNVTKVRTDSSEYIANILLQEHGSVMEHAQYTFIFQDVSRVFTHELVRHRAGVAISQESLRYVRLTDLGFRIPEVLEPLRPQVVSIVERLEDFQRDAAEHFGLDDGGVPFHHKKEVTSALRRLAPLGLSTSIMWSANLRTIRFVIEKRAAAGAEEEIRAVFSQVASIMCQQAPDVFQDFKAEGLTWTPGSSKV